MNIQEELQYWKDEAFYWKGRAELAERRLFGSAPLPMPSPRPAAVSPAFSGAISATGPAQPPPRPTEGGEMTFVGRLESPATEAGGPMANPLPGAPPLAQSLSLSDDTRKQIYDSLVEKFGKERADRDFEATCRMVLDGMLIQSQMAPGAPPLRGTIRR